MHSFAPFWNPQSKLGKETGKKRTWSKQSRKSENERPLSSSSLPSTSAKGGCEEKLTRMKIEYGDDIWSIVSLKIAERFADFFNKFLQICQNFAEILQTFDEFFSGFFPKCSIFAKLNFLFKNL